MATATSHRYDLVAVDLDGTLIDHHGRIHPENIAAVAEARRRGITVAICTGRALIECRQVIEAIAHEDPCIVAGGAIVADATTGRTLERFTMQAALVEQVVAHLDRERHPALLLKDSGAVGYDYLVVSPGGPEALDPASKWWFRKMGVRTRYVPRLEDDPHPADTVRVGAYAANRSITPLADALRARFGAVAALQHFDGVLLPKDRVEEGVTSVHIVELFHQQADKWQALARLAGRLGVPVARTAAIGDQTNDLTMITHAGLGVAMGNAMAEVTQAAGRHTRRCEEAGVAYALERIMAGEW